MSVMRVEAMFRDLIRRLHVHKNTLFDSALISSVALALTLIWFRKGLMLGAGEDLLRFHNTIRHFNRALYVWWDVDTGNAHPYRMPVAPFWLFVGLLELLGVPEVLLQATFLFFILSLNGLSLYYLTSLLIGLKSKRIVGILSGLFYMLNPYAMSNTWHRWLYSWISLSPLLPIMLIFYIKGLKEHKKKYAFYLCVIPQLFGYALGMPPALGTISLPLVLFFIFYVVENRHKISEIIYASKFSLLSIFLALLLNSWWFLPFFATAWNFFTLRIPTSFNLDTVLFVSRTHWRLIYTVRLIHPYYTYVHLYPIYSSLPFEGISFLIPIIAFSSGLTKIRKKYYLCYFLCLSILGLFLAKGTNPPLGEVLVWIFTYLPPLRIYGNTFEKLGPLLPLGYAPLIGIGLSSSYHRIRNRFSTNSAKKVVAPLVLGIISISIFIAYPWSMWSGNVFTSPEPPANNPEIGYYVEIPSYYHEADAWLSSQSDEFRVISLPWIGGVGITYAWKYGFTGLELSESLFTKPFVSKSIFVPHVDDITETRLKPVLYNADQSWKIMALFNSKYLLLHRDIDYKTSRTESPEYVRKNVLNKALHISYVKTFGKLDFYKIDDDYFLDRIYPTNQFVFSANVDTMLFNDIQNDSFIPENTVIFLQSQDGINNVTLLESLRANYLYKPDITFRKINPTKYSIRILNASDPFFLVFSETFYPHWKAYINGEEVPDEYHFIANGYANAWYINERGSFDVTLEFWPQKLVYAGSIISLVTLALCIVYLAKDRIKAIYHDTLRKKAAINLPLCKPYLSSASIEGSVTAYEYD